MCLTSKKVDVDKKGSSLDQCFPTFISSRHPYLVLQVFCGIPIWFNRYTDQVIVTIGGTPVTSSRHPSVPRHAGWEPLLYIPILPKRRQILCASHQTF